MPLDRGSSRFGSSLTKSGIFLRDLTFPNIRENPYKKFLEAELMVVAEMILITDNQ